jgi:hypothetical protein
MACLDPRVGSATAPMRKFWPRFVSQRADVPAAVYVLVLTLVMLALGVMPGLGSARHHQRGHAAALGGPRVGHRRARLRRIARHSAGHPRIAHCWFRGSPRCHPHRRCRWCGGWLLRDLLCMRLSAFQVVASFILAAVIVAFSGPAPGRGNDLAAGVAAGGPAHARRGDAHQASGICRCGPLLRHRRGQHLDG